MQTPPAQLELAVHGSPPQLESFQHLNLIHLFFISANEYLVIILSYRSNSITFIQTN